MTEAEKDLMLEEDFQDSRIYEAAFHLVPTLNDDGAAADAAEIRAFLESRGASILGFGAPMLMELAYPIKKDIERTRHTFTRSYFGWFVFEATPEVAHETKEMLGARSSVIRALLMKTEKEAALDRVHPATVSAPLTGDAADEEEPVEVVAEEGAPEALVKEEKTAMDVEEVDAEIAKLVA